MRIRFRVEYLGTPFNGWQKQPNTSETIQAYVERALKTTLRIPVDIIGSGRTDTGVHAYGQMAHADLDLDDVDPKKLQKSLNGILPSSIAIREMQKCSDDFHARFSALERYYIYRIRTRKTVLDASTSWEYIKFPIDVDRVKETALHFAGTHDFNAFSMPRNDGRNTLCTLKPIEIVSTDHSIDFHIVGNRFLHGMIRSLVGCMVESGKGRWKPGDTPAALLQNIASPRIWAPPIGLTLQDVVYDES